MIGKRSVGRGETLNEYSSDLAGIQYLDVELKEEPGHERTATKPTEGTAEPPIQ